MGSEGLRHASEVAILNANYMSKRLEGYYKTVFTNENGRSKSFILKRCLTKSLIFLHALIHV